MSNEIYHHGILGMKWGIRRFQNDDGVLVSLGLGLHFHFGRKLEENGMGITQREFYQIALVGNTVADTYEFQCLGVTGAHADDHIVHECAIEAVESLFLFEVNGAVLVDFEYEVAIVFLDDDGRVDLL